MNAVTLQKFRAHEDERERLAALRALNILDTPPEDRFDRITEWASDLFDTPAALVSLVDRGRQWFKSRRGFDMPETPRNLAFCDHTVRSDAVFIVYDASKHTEFMDNPLVTGHPHIRFYAGAPIMSPDGFRIGAVCVIDHAPRAAVSEAQISSLQLLAKFAAAECADRCVMEREVQQRSGEKQEFLRTLSHELRTPLNAVVGFTDLMLLGHAGSLTPEQRSYLDLVHGATHSLLGFLDKLMMEAELSGDLPRGLKGKGLYDS